MPILLAIEVLSVVMAMPGVRIPGVEAKIVGGLRRVAAGNAVDETGAHAAADETMVELAGGA